MVDLSKLKNVKFQIDERAKLRAAIALNIGMSFGMIAAFVAVILSSMAIWYKIFAAFGLFCATLLQLSGVLSTIKRLKDYNAAMKEFEKFSTNTEPVSYAG